VFVTGAIGRGKGKKTWEECVKLDLKSCDLTTEAALDTDEWIGLIVGIRSTRASMQKDVKSLMTTMTVTCTFTYNHCLPEHCSPLNKPYHSCP